MIIAGMDFPTLTLVMLFYSFIGWLYESTVFSLCEQGKFMDRGCFVGPLCPIYSVVSVISLCLFSNISSSWEILIFSGLATCVIEYMTSVGLEALFHKRYWDYSYYPLNIDGRVSVVSGLFFGVALLLMIKVIHPFTIGVLSHFSPRWRLILCIVTWTLFISDMIWTVIGNLTKDNRIKQAYDATYAWKQRRCDVLNAWKDKKSDMPVVRGAIKVLNTGKALNRKAVDMQNKAVEKVSDKLERYRGQDGEDQE